MTKTSPSAERRERRQDQAPARNDALLPAKSSWWRGTFGQSAIGAVLLWAALPPLQLWPLAWLAPVAWIRLAEHKELPGRRPYLALWLSGFLFWLAAIYWLTLPHWATAFGWLALSFYLALYLPLFVGLTRIAIHRWRASPMVAAPVAWTGLELARSHVLGGFMMAGLGHTQYERLGLIQISDLGGAYAVSFLVALVAACLARAMPLEERRASLRPLVPAVVAIGLTLGYGHYRLAQQTTRPGPKVALIQGSIDTEIKSDPNQNQHVYEHYFRLSAEAVRDHRDLDLMVWPETMFRTPWFTFAPDYRPADDVPWTPSQATARSRGDIQSTVALLQTPMLVGAESLYYAPDRIERFNSALLADPAGNVLGRYDKVHLVMFGEYVPLADRFPWLYKLTPLASGLDAGTSPKSLALGVVRYAPNICYESTVPHLIRSHVRELRASGEEPDVLVNLTNDGWFWGSSELDMHLVCGVFRAIECRKPFLIAANTGISAWIDASGRIVDRGGRRTTGVVVAETQLDARQSPYLAIGDWPAGLCLAMCVAILLTGARRSANT